MRLQLLKSCQLKIVESSDVGLIYLQLMLVLGFGSVNKVRGWGAPLSNTHHTQSSNATSSRSVGNGSSIYFWLDPWFADQPLKLLCPNLFRLEMVKNCSVRDRLEGGSLWLWRHDPSTAEEISEWDNLCRQLSSVSLSNREDSWRWIGNGSSSFSIAAVKSLIISMEEFSSRNVMGWVKWVPLKCSIFAWRADLNRIPTVEVLSRRGIEVEDSLCSFCSSEGESVDHLFTACPWSAVLWQKIEAWCRIPQIFMFTFRDLFDIHNHCGKRGAEKYALQGILIVSCWCLWKARNNFRFAGKQFKVKGVFSEVKSVSYVWFKYRSKYSSISWSDWCKFVLM
ncbi:putative reverse transcriptase zinc-binding domain-containing protein [Helianthus annuus]|nr:putative reverse transcriptase zinc-binding domain-containing protein [Helianthus annuus]